MYLQVLKNISRSRSLTQANLARMAGVSRAAVTKWFQQDKKGRDWVNVETGTLIRLGKELGVSPSLFLEERKNLNSFKIIFLWDNLYSTMEEFVGALIQLREPALARLVQVVGFHHASQVVGKKIFKHFDQYKRFIKPIRRRELEILWPLYNS